MDDVLLAAARLALDNDAIGIERFAGERTARYLFGLVQNLCKSITFINTLHKLPTCQTHSPIKHCPILLIVYSACNCPPFVW